MSKLSAKLVGRPTRWERDDKSNGFRRPGLRESDSGGESSEGNRDKKGSKFHFCLPIFLWKEFNG